MIQWLRAPVSTTRGNLLGLQATLWIAVLVAPWVAVIAASREERRIRALDFARKVHESTASPTKEG